MQIFLSNGQKSVVIKSNLHGLRLRLLNTVIKQTPTEMAEGDVKPGLLRSKISPRQARASGQIKGEATFTTRRSHRIEKRERLEINE